jgi:hypothetical protein
MRASRLFPLLVLLLPGCATVSEEPREVSPWNPVSWVQSMILPEGESFYDDRSREIERSLNYRIERGTGGVQFE